jgi:hypothetical protein
MVALGPGAVFLDVGLRVELGGQGNMILKLVTPLSNILAWGNSQVCISLISC